MVDVTGGERWRAATLLAIVLGSSAACALAAPGSKSLTDTLIRRGEPAVEYGEPRQMEAGLLEYTRLVRNAQLDARPRPKRDGSDSVESASVVLKQLLAALGQQSSALQHRAVAQEYRRLGILDAAYSHLTRALALDPKDAVAYDLRARIWRQWDLPQFGVSDANRAVFYAPRSAVAWNTLGTLLHLSGQLEEASRVYGRALSFDGGARYVWNNVCRLRRDQGRSDQAAEACARARGPDSATDMSMHDEPTVSGDDLGSPIVAPSAQRAAGAANAMRALMSTAGLSGRVSTVDDLVSASRVAARPLADGREPTLHFVTAGPPAAAHVPLPYSSLDSMARRVASGPQHEQR